MEIIPKKFYSEDSYKTFAAEYCGDLIVLHKILVSNDIIINKKVFRAVYRAGIKSNHEWQALEQSTNGTSDLLSLIDKCGRYGDIDYYLYMIKKHGMHADINTHLDFIEVCDALDDNLPMVWTYMRNADSFNIDDYQICGNLIDGEMELILRHK